MLFKKRKEKQRHLLEWQKAIEPNSPDKLVMTEGQLKHTSEQQATNDLKIIQDCNNIISDTTNPETFFSRFDLMKERCEHLKRLEPYIQFSGASPTEALHEIVDNEQEAVYIFIARYYNSVLEKAESLKTKKGKDNQFQKFYDSLQPYHNRMDARNINYIESKRNDRNVNLFGEPLDKLVDGDLPWGWIAHNKDFTDKIHDEYSFFLQQWIDCRNRSPKELYFALKSFVKYMEDVEKLCKSKGECFEFWFYNVLTSTDYILKRKDELKNLEINVTELQKEYEQNKQFAVQLESQVFQVLQDNEGILQADLKKMFDEKKQRIVSDILYNLYKDGKIEKVKSGRTYKLYIKK